MKLKLTYVIINAIRKIKYKKNGVYICKFKKVEYDRNNNKIIFFEIYFVLIMYNFKGTLLFFSMINRFPYFNQIQRILKLIHF